MIWHVSERDARAAPKKVGTRFRRLNGYHVLILSTTGKLLGGSVTTGKRVYMVNLYKRPAQPVAGLATWFPSRGIPAL